MMTTRIGKRKMTVSKSVCCVASHTCHYQADLQLQNRTLLNKKRDTKYEHIEDSKLIFANNIIIAKSSKIVAYIQANQFCLRVNGVNIINIIGAP